MFESNKPDKAPPLPRKTQGLLLHTSGFIIIIDYRHTTTTGYIVVLYHKQGEDANTGIAN